MNYDSYFKYYAKKSKQKQLNCNSYQYYFSDYVFIMYEAEFDNTFYYLINPLLYQVIVK